MDSLTNVALNLQVGLLSLIAVNGVGRLLSRPLRPLAVHWYTAVSMLAGFALGSVFIQCLAMAGSGRTGLKVLSAGLVILGIAGNWVGRGRYYYFSPAQPQAGPFRRLRSGILCLLPAVMISISLALSTRIDEPH